MEAIYLINSNSCYSVTRYYGGDPFISPEGLQNLGDMN